VLVRVRVGGLGLCAMAGLSFYDSDGFDSGSGTIWRRPRCALSLLHTDSNPSARPAINMLWQHFMNPALITTLKAPSCRHLSINNYLTILLIKFGLW